MVPLSGGQRRTVYKSPQPQRDWKTGAALDAGIIIGATLATTLLLLIVSGQVLDTTAGNLFSRSAAPLTAVSIESTPQPSPSLAPSPGSQPTRSSQPPAPTPSATEAAESVEDDTAIQDTIDKRLQNEPPARDITATVTNGRVTLVGTVTSDEAKGRIEKLVRSISGVKSVDNQIVVVSN